MVHCRPMVDNIDPVAALQLIKTTHTWWWCQDIWSGYNTAGVRKILVEISYYSFDETSCAKALTTYAPSAGAFATPTSGFSHTSRNQKAMEANRWTFGALIFNRHNIPSTWASRTFRLMTCIQSSQQSLQRLESYLGEHHFFNATGITFR